MASTAAHRLASHLLGQDLTAWIGERKAEGLSFERIAVQLAQDTDGEIVVSGETIRRWHLRGEAVAS